MKRLLPVIPYILAIIIGAVGIVGIVQTQNIIKQNKLVGAGWNAQLSKPVVPSGGTSATSSEFVGDIIPSITNQFNLGEPGKSWKNIYASGTLLVNGLATFPAGFISQASSTVSSNFNVAGVLSASGTISLGDGSGALASLTLEKSNAITQNNFIAFRQNAVTKPSYIQFLNPASGATTNGFVGVEGSTAGNLVTGDLGGSFVFGAFTASHIQLATNNVIRLTIGSSGGVIIGAGGKATPQAMFQVSGGDSWFSGGNLTVGGIPGTTVSSTLGGNFLAIATSTSNGAGLFFVDSSGNISASGTAKVFGLSTLTGLISTASSSFSDGLQVAGALNASSTFQVAGATVLAGTVTLSSTLSVSGLSTLTGGFISSASSSIGADLNVSGRLNAGNNFTVASSTANGAGLFYVDSSGNVSASGTIMVNATAVSSTQLTSMGMLHVGKNSTNFAMGVFMVDGSTGGNGNITTSGTIGFAYTYGSTSSTINKACGISLIDSAVAGGYYAIVNNNLVVSTTLVQATYRNASPNTTAPVSATTTRGQISINALGGISVGTAEVQWCITQTN